MSEISVRSLSPADWSAYRDVRLTALADSPDAFSATHDDEQSWSDEQWQERMERSPRFVAEQGDGVVGTVSLGRGSHDTDLDTEQLGELFGLWVRPQSRGTGVATALAHAAADAARQRGDSHIVYWVSTDNGRAVAFASGLGFRPTDSRRPMRGARHEGETEIAMILPLGRDRGTISSPS